MFDALEKSVVVSACDSISRGGKALDAGAGSGRFTVELASRGLHVFACDTSQAMLNLLRSKIEHLQLQTLVDISRQDLTSLALRSDQFDLVVCIRVLVNLDTRQNLVKGLAELVRVCKPGGRIVFDNVNPMSLAILGKRKESMVKTDDLKGMIESMPGITLEVGFGRRILTQTLYNIVPSLFLEPLDLVDRNLSRMLPKYSVRNYYVLRKEGAQN